MRSCFLEYDGPGEVQNLPPVCMKCGRPATETVEVDYLNLERSATVTVHVPLCRKHPFVGFMYSFVIIAALSLLVLCVLAVFLLPHRVAFFFAEMLASLFVVLWAFYPLYDFHAARIQDDGITLWPVSGNFRQAYQEQLQSGGRRGRKRRAATEPLSVGQKPTLTEYGELAGEDDLRPVRRKKRKRRRVRFEDVNPSSGTVWASVGWVAGAWMGLFVVTMIAYPPWKAKLPPGERKRQVARKDVNDRKSDDWLNPFANLGKTRVEKKTSDDGDAIRVKVPANGRPESPAEVAGLIAYFPLDEGEGGAIADKSANALSGTLRGGQWMDGRHGQAVWIRRNEYVDLGQSPRLNFGSGKPFTLCGWAATREKDATLVSFRNSKSGAPVIDVRIAQGKLTADVRADGIEFGHAAVPGAAMADAKWRHFALLRHNDGTAELYLDGRSVGKARGRNSGGAITTDMRSLGAERYWATVKAGTGSPHYVGAIDEFAVFGRALTADEIRALAGR